jgi:plasmid maintenance system antidote protein VapI
LFIFVQTAAMLPPFNDIAGIHPGAILRYALKKQARSGKQMAEAMDEHPQTISAIMNEKRGINPVLSIKLAQQLGVPNDYFMLLQAAWEVKLAADKVAKSPIPPKLRKELFWDTRFEQIHWQHQAPAVIQRVLERGNEADLKELLTYYGAAQIRKVAEQLGQNALPGWENNLKRMEQMQ